MSKFEGKYGNLWAGWDTKIDIEEQNVRADRGAVAAGDDIEDSAVNTGRFEGIQNAGWGKVDASHAVIGDGNVTFNGSQVGAASFGPGDATNVSAYNANLGSGTLNDIDAAGNVNMGSGTLIDVAGSGGGQTVVGNGNEVTGDVAVDLHGVSGNANVAVGDGNDQFALQDNDTFVDQSFTDNSVTETTIDNSIDDSFNTRVEDSFNVEQEITSVYEDNDVYESNSWYEDHSSYVEKHTTTDVDVDLHKAYGVDLDLDLDV